MLKWISAAIGATCLAIASAYAAPLEKSHVSIGVGGKPLLYYLPLTIAEQKGYFKDEGLNVTINDFRGGGQALQALIGGSVDAVTGAFEHTLRMQAKNQDVRAILELNRYPGLVLAVRSDRASMNRPGDLKGAKIGVSSAGSSTHQFLNFLIARDGLKPEDVSIITVGTGATAVAAIDKGEIDGLVSLEIAIAALERDKKIKVLVDTRTEDGTRKLFGGTNPAASLYSRREFYEKNPNTAQAITNALYKALKWLERANAEDVVATVPQDYYVADKALYMDSVKRALPGYSRDGIVTSEGIAAAMKMLSFDKEISEAKFDTAKSFEPGFAKAAARQIK